MKFNVLPNIEFGESSFNHFSGSNWNQRHFESCLLIKASFSIPDPLDTSHPGDFTQRYYFLEPVFTIRATTRDKFLRIRRLNELKDFGKIFDYLKFCVLDSLSLAKGQPHWTIAMECLVKHQLLAEKDTKTEQPFFEYRYGQLIDVLTNMLKRKGYNGTQLQEIFQDLKNLLVPEKIQHTNYYGHNSSDIGYTRSELDDMYRSAYENDSSNEWNND